MDVTLSYEMVDTADSSRRSLFTKEVHSAQVPQVGDLVAVGRHRYRVDQRTWHHELRRVTVALVRASSTRDLSPAAEADALRADQWTAHSPTLLADLPALTGEPGTGT